MEPIQQIQLLEERLIEAMKSSDVATLDRLISDELIFTSHNGQFFTKEADLAAHRSGDIKIFDITLGEMYMKQFDDVVIVSVRKEISGSFFGAVEVGIFRFTRVWKKYADDWKVIAGHSTQLVH